MINEPENANKCVGGQHLEVWSANLLVNIVRAPVSHQHIVPFAFWSLGVDLGETLIKTRNEVDAMDDIVRVKEPKSTTAQDRDKLYPIQPFCFPASLVFLVELEPANPEDVHVGWVSH